MGRRAPGRPLISPDRLLRRRCCILDHRILGLLQEDASLNAAEIATRVGLSQSPCWRRIQRLEQDGFIRERIAVLDRKQLGFNLVVFVQVRFSRENAETLSAFEAAIRAAPEVQECYMLMGDVDADGMADFQLLLAGVTSITAADIWL